jgi:hypothetical protein
VAMTKSFVTQMIGGLNPRVVLLLTPVVGKFFCVQESKGTVSKASHSCYPLPAHVPTEKRNAEPLMVMRAIVPVYAVRNRLVMIGPLTNLLLVLAGRRLVQLASHLMF